MVNWTQRFITGIIVAPLVLYAIRSQLTTVFIANLFLFLLHNEYKGLIINILKYNSSDSDRWYIDSMGASWFVRVPTHYFMTVIAINNCQMETHLHLFISILLILFVRMLNFLKITEFLQQNEKNIEEKFPKHIVFKRIQMLTFFQVGADILQFMIFVYPLSFIIIVFKYKQAAAINLIWIISSWQTDNGALFIGSMFGKNPFCPKISPNKTWEGVSGGIFLSVFSALILSQVNFLSLITLEALHTKHFLIISLIISAVSIFGDLFESFIKRVADVKDSGKTFPGHGGILDRMDSLCFSAPVVYLYINLFIPNVLEIAQ